MNEYSFTLPDARCAAQRHNCMPQDSTSFLFRRASRRISACRAYTSTLARLYAQLLEELLAEFRHLRRDDRDTVTLTRIASEIALVIVLRLVESRRRRHFRHNGPAPRLGGGRLRDLRLGDLLLLRRVIEDGRAILCAVVRTLAIQ